jgi:hypothetical protein
VEREALVAILMPLSIAARVKMDAPQWRVYEKVLEDVPPGLLSAAVDALLKAGSPWMPKPGEIRVAAEQCRQALSAQLKFEPCESCSRTGWAPVLVDGVPRVERCACWSAHQQRLSEAGVSAKPLALPPARDSDWTAAGDAA